MVDIDTKPCSMCGKVKPISEFRLMNQYGKRYAYCKECEQIYNRDYHRHQREMNKETADRLKMVIKESGIKKIEIADDLGISIGRLDALCYNQAVPNLQMFRSICEMFSINADWLLFGRGQKHVKS